MNIRKKLQRDQATKDRRMMAPSRRCSWPILLRKGNRAKITYAQWCDAAAKYYGGRDYVVRQAMNLFSRRINAITWNDGIDLTSEPLGAVNEQHENSSISFNELELRYAAHLGYTK